MNVAEKHRLEIVREMKARDLTTSELARFAGVGRGKMIDFLAGRINPTCAWLDKVYAGLKRKRKKRK